MKTQSFESAGTDSYSSTLCLSAPMHADLFSKGHSAAGNKAFTVHGEVYKA